MSTYNKKEKWIHTWDTLFWNFLKLHKEKIKKIPRLSFLLKYID